MLVFAVIACSKCATPWSVETRHVTSTCPRCGKESKLATRTKLWMGENAGKAREAVASLSGQEGALSIDLLSREPVRKHDSPAAAAASKARIVANASKKAVLIMETLTNILGDVPEKEALIAMRDAGLTSERAEKEIVRMLACDEIFEPRLGFYRSLSS